MIWCLGGLTVVMLNQIAKDQGLDPCSDLLGRF